MNIILYCPCLKSFNHLSFIFVVYYYVFFFLGEFYFYSFLLSINIESVLGFVWPRILKIKMGVLDSKR